MTATGTPPVESEDEPQHPRYSHGTRAALRPGDLITAGHRLRCRDDVVMNHACFTARRDGGDRPPRSSTDEDADTPHG